MTRAESTTPPNWTAGLRRRITRTVPAGQWLPDRQPAYVIGSGVALAIGGSTWWHTSSLGHFLNSMHLWSVELFFVFMVIHLWGKFFMAAWRGRRAMTWITGAVAFVGSIGTAFTGYLSQSNFDSQWISTQAKDGLNSVGVGAYFNVLNPAQMLLWHIVLLPLVVGFLVVAHIVLVRRHGVVPPFDAQPSDFMPAPRQELLTDAVPDHAPRDREVQDLAVEDPAGRDSAIPGAARDLAVPGNGSAVPGNGSPPPLTLDTGGPSTAVGA
jgi:hypothetical protein